ncbi:hypothetical protein BC833DRAFT_625931 [Globomyces pollinis-pini]|nr:hypothetical protein BC833DRAFT_625931 [Globomyces pollinis-pini]
MCSKDLNHNVQLNQQQLDELYDKKKLFNNAAAFKKYLRLKEPREVDLEYAIDNFQDDIVRILLEDGRLDPSEDNNSAIKFAARYGYAEILKILLKDKRVDPAVERNYAIRYASECGRTDIVKLLLNDERVDPFVDDRYAIRKSFLHGHTEIVRLLLHDKRISNPT